MLEDRGSVVEKRSLLENSKFSKVLMISTRTFEPTVQKLNIIPAYMLVKRERRDSSCLINLECRYRKLSPLSKFEIFIMTFSVGPSTTIQGSLTTGTVVRAIKKFSKILSIQNICPYFQLTRKTILHHYWVKRNTIPQEITIHLSLLARNI